MTTKEDALAECTKTLEKGYVAQFYERYLQTSPQGDTVRTLLEGIKSKNITAEDALNIALLVGVQWGVKFEGTP